MPRISLQKKEKIQEQILFYAYNKFPQAVFISDIAKEIARDEEFIKELVLELHKKELIVKIDKNPLGIPYIKRLRWRLSSKAQEAYSTQQKSKVIIAE